jgi:3-oxoacyl-[acyl-carrier-protein] synthase II
MEASFLANLGLAITSLEQGRLFGPLAPEEPIETRGGDGAEKIVVTSWGHYRGEALAMIERIA